MLISQKVFYIGHFFYYQSAGITFLGDFSFFPNLLDQKISLTASIQSFFSALWKKLSCLKKIHTRSKRVLLSLENEIRKEVEKKAFDTFQFVAYFIYKYSHKYSHLEVWSLRIEAEGSRWILKIRRLICKLSILNFQSIKLLKHGSHTFFTTFWKDRKSKRRKLAWR